MIPQEVHFSHALFPGRVHPKSPGWWPRWCVDPRSQERPASEKEDSDEESNEATEDSEAEETVGEMMFDDHRWWFDPKIWHIHDLRLEMIQFWRLHIYYKKNGWFNHQPDEKLWEVNDAHWMLMGLKNLDQNSNVNMVQDYERISCSKSFLSNLMLIMWRDANTWWPGV